MADQHENWEYDFAPRETPKPEPEAEPELELKPAAPQAPVEAEPPVQERICPNCGFHVVGKTPKNRCPECTGDLAATAELLQFSSPAWSRTLANGALLLIPAVLLHCGAMTQAWLDDSATAGALLHVAGAVITLLGIWLLTTKECRAKAPPLQWALPSRIFAILSLLLAGLLLIPFTRHPEISTLLIVSLLLSFALLSLTVGLRLRALAVRAASDSLFWWSQNLSWLVPLCALGQIPFHIVGRAKAEFLMLFMCAIPLAAGYAVVALAACFTLSKAAAELRSAALANEGIAARRLKKEEEMAAAKANRRG